LFDVLPMPSHPVRPMVSAQAAKKGRKKREFMISLDRYNNQLD